MARLVCNITRMRLGSAFLVLGFLGVSLSQNPPAAAHDPFHILQFVNQTINWYRQVNFQQQVASEPSDLFVVNDNHRMADEVVRQAFDFARAEAELIVKQPAPTHEADQSSPSSRYQSLYQLSSKLDQQIKQTRAELDSFRQKLNTATGHRRQVLESTIEETQSELELAEVRRDAVRSMVDFVSGASASGLGANGFRAQIEALARSLPAEVSQSTNSGEKRPTWAQPSNSSTAPGNKPEPSGIWGLAADFLRLSTKDKTLDGSMRQTDALQETIQQFRAPLIDELKQLSDQGDQIANQPDSTDPRILAEQKKELDRCTAQFKQISAAVLPLSKQEILLGLYKTNLLNWRAAIRSEYRSDLKGLLIRLAILGIVLAFVLGFAELWRKTIVRYVHDSRRRYQFLLLRKIVLWFVITLVIAFAFASQLGSVATFAGLITAGVAVALQNVILSIAGYFFLIGRFGIRVGDRVQIAGVTGDVVDVGLVRLHVMEVGPGGATGRVVAFSNSIVFQPTTGMFKQIPGTNFVWHEITLTLSPESDYHAVEERLLDAVQKVFADYRDEMERQRRAMERTLSAATINELLPRSWLRLTSLGLEAVIRFPVDLEHATEIDDRVTRELLKEIDRDPKLKLVGSGTPMIRLRTDLTTAEVKQGQ